MNELIKLIGVLEIPITEYREGVGYVEIILNNKLIGSVPYIEVSGIRTYDKSEAILENLNWTTVYEECKNDILKAIISTLKINDAIITFSTYSLVNLRESESSPLQIVECKYLNDAGWKVYALT